MTTQSGPVRTPQTAAEYRASLQDGREVWFRGEKVKDVTAHPAFQTGVASVARLYDALHDPALRDELTAPTDTGSGGFTHPFFKAPQTVDDLRASHRAIAAWQRLTFGWMGRSPDYKGSFLATLGGSPDAYAPFQDNARAWYARAQEQVLFLGHAIGNAPTDRHLPRGQVSDVHLRIVGENDAGIRVSGVKVVATGSALAQCVLVSYVGPPLTDPAQAVAVIAPMDSPGLKIVCRASYEQAAHNNGSPYDYPLSSRFDENDAILIFDNVFIPWENVLIHRDTDRADKFFVESGFLPRFIFHSAIRLGVKLDFLCGLFVRAIHTTGSDNNRGVQMAAGEAIAWRHAAWAQAHAMTEQPQRRADGSLIPNLEYALAYRVFGPMAYARVKELIETNLGSSLIYLNSHADDFHNPELRPYLDTYLRGSHGIDAEDRVKLMKLLWDSVGSEFAGRHSLYEHHYAGPADVVRIAAYEHALDGGLADELSGYVDTCMNDYDLRGWTAPDLAAASGIESSSAEIVR